MFLWETDFIYIQQISFDFLLHKGLNHTSRVVGKHLNYPPEHAQRSQNMFSSTVPHNRLEVSRDLEILGSSKHLKILNDYKQTSCNWFVVHAGTFFFLTYAVIYVPHQRWGGILLSVQIPGVGVPSLYPSFSLNQLVEYYKTFKDTSLGQAKDLGFVGLDPIFKVIEGLRLSNVLTNFLYARYLLSQYMEFCQTCKNISSGQAL